MTTYSIQNNVPWSATFPIPGSASLVGASMHMQLRTAAGSTAVALDMTTANFLSFIDTTNRIGGIHVDGPSMLQVPANTYVYDCVVTPATGDAFVADSGTVTVTQGVTR